MVFVGLAVEPLPRDTGVEFVCAVDQTSWSSAWLDAVEQGVRDSLQSGVLKGCPVRDIRVRILELRKKEGESTAAGYHMAAVAALKQALGAARPVLLEPIMWVEIVLPEEYVGDAISLLGAKGAKVENIFDRAGQKTVQALAPMRSLFGFSTDLRSATQGRAGPALEIRPVRRIGVTFVSRAWREQFPIFAGFLAANHSPAWLKVKLRGFGCV